MKPSNLPLAIGLDYGADAVAQVLKGETNSLAENIALLGKYFKIKIKFTEPIKVSIQPYREQGVDEKGYRWWKRIHSKTVTEHVFKGFFKQGSYLYYLIKKNGRHGYPFDFLDKVKDWELVIERNGNDTFANYEEFKKKFDLFFITEKEIQKLWNGTSSQHGGKYQPSDFRKMGPRGLEVMKKFLVHFKGINSGEESGYSQSCHGDYKVLREKYDSWDRRGRDISIEHATGNSFVWYSSEFHCCGNGRYGLVANKRKYLHLEDD